MPGKKKKNKFDLYQERNLFYNLQAFQTQFSATGSMIDVDAKKYEEKEEQLNTILDNGQKIYGGQKLYGIGFTGNYLSDLKESAEVLQQCKASAKRMKEGLKTYQGSFKKIMEAELYIYDPSNGNLLDLSIENRSVERLLVSFADSPVTFDSKEIEVLVDDPKQPGKKKAKTKTVRTFDAERDKQRKEMLGEFATYYTEYLTAVKEMVQVMYERQKAEKEGELGLEKDYLEKYATAAEKVTQTYDVLKKAADERYQNPKLTQTQKDLQYFPNSNTPILNNPLSETTSSDPNHISRNDIPVAVADLKGQVQAVKNGWPLRELGVLGCLNLIEQGIKYQQRNTRIKIQSEQSKIHIYEQMLQKAREKEQNRAGEKTEVTKKELEKQQKAKTGIEDAKKSLQELEERLQKCDEALKEIVPIKEQYWEKKNPSFAERQKAVREVLALGNQCIRENTLDAIYRGNLDCMRDKMEDPFHFMEKNRYEQAKSMLDGLNEIDIIGRSSPNFRALKRSMSQLVDMAKAHPKMTQEQLTDYQKQMEVIQEKITQYLNGKNEEEKKYLEKHPDQKKLVRSEYTSKRINAVRLLSDQLYTHLEIDWEKSPFFKETAEAIKDGSFHFEPGKEPKIPFDAIQKMATDLDKTQKRTNTSKSVYQPLYEQKLSADMEYRIQKYQKKHRDTDKSLLMETVYKFLMVSVIDATVGKAKPYNEVNRALQSIEDGNQRYCFIENELSEQFRENFTKKVMDTITEGKVPGKQQILEACDKALAKTMDDAEMEEDFAVLKQTKKMVDMLKRNQRTVGNYRASAQKQKKTEKAAQTVRNL